MNIYIIANNLELTENDISKINNQIKLNSEDLIIRINSFPKKLNNLLFGKTTHLYYRCGGGFCHMKRFDNFLGSDINYGLIMWESHDKELLNQIAYDSHKIIPSEYLYIQDELCDLLKDEPSSG